MAQYRDATDESTLTIEKPKTESPRMYKVFLHNDDYTPMDFVVSIVETIFHKSHEEAVHIMLSVHRKGIGLCGIFTREIAETKTCEVIHLSKENEYPLQCTMEPE